MRSEDGTVALKNKVNVLEHRLALRDKAAEELSEAASDADARVSDLKIQLESARQKVANESLVISQLPSIA